VKVEELFCDRVQGCDFRGFASSESSRRSPMASHSALLSDL
jgi:hypothetical protein